MRQVRITKFKMRAEAAAAARELMHDLKGEILGLPGVRRMVIVMNPDGTGHVIALIDEDGTSPEAIDRVRAVWRKFHDHLETMPDPEIYEVIADWGDD